MKEHIIRAILYQNMSSKWKDAELNGDVNVHLNVHQKARQFVEVELGDFLLSDGEAVLASFERQEDGEINHINPARMDYVDGVFRIQIPTLVHNTPGVWGVEFTIVTGYDAVTGEYDNAYVSDKLFFSEHSSFLDDGLTVPTKENFSAFYKETKEKVEDWTAEKFNELQENINENIEVLQEKVSQSTTDISKNANKIALLTDAQLQSGLQYIQPITQSYNERITANGESILDNQGNGSPARILTVDGDTQKTTNLFNHNNIERIGGEAPDFAIDENGVLTVNHGWNCEIDLPAGEYTISIEGATKTITVYWLSREITINPHSGVYNVYHFELIEQTKILVTCAEPSVITRLQIEKGNVATKYTPYFDGLKSVEFGGIKSIGKNLCRIEPFVLPTTVEGNKKMNRVSPIFIPAGTYYCHLVLEGYENKTILSRTVGCYLKDKYDKLVKEVSSDGIIIINDNEASRITTFSVFYNAGENISEEELLKMLGKTVKIMFNRGGEGLPYEPYVESVLSLPSAIDCGLGTIIDFENQKIIETYGEYTFDGSETVDVMGAYNDNFYYYLVWGNYTMLLGAGQNGLCDRYPTDKRGWLDADKECIRFGQGNNAVYLILKQDLTADEVKALINGMKIRYPLETPIETPFTEEEIAVGNEYTAWKHGMEEVQGNANSSYGIYPTLTQEYVAVIDIQDTIQDSIEESIDSSIRQALQGEY